MKSDAKRTRGDKSIRMEGPTLHSLTCPYMEESPIKGGENLIKTNK